MQQIPIVGLGHSHAEADPAPDLGDPTTVGGRVRERVGTDLAAGRPSPGARHMDPQIPATAWLLTHPVHLAHLMHEPMNPADWTEGPR
jgi:hypothetical protein